MLCLLSSLSLCPWSVACEYGSISRFKAFLAGFGRFVWVCVVLVRCVACVALYACGVRRFYGLWRVCLYFSSSLPFFLSLYLLFVLRLVCFVLVVFCLSSCLVLFVLVSLLLFLFPLRTIRKKRGRAVLVRPLLVCCELLVRCP